MADFLKIASIFCVTLTLAGGSAAFAADTVKKAEKKVETKKEIAGIDLDSFDTDEATKTALEKLFPINSSSEDIVVALGKSVPPLICTQDNSSDIVCLGKSMFGGGFIVEKNWEVVVNTAQDKIKAIRVRTQQNHTDLRP